MNNATHPQIRQTTATPPTTPSPQLRGAEAAPWCLAVMNQLWLILPLWGLGRAAVAVLQCCCTGTTRASHRLLFTQRQTGTDGQLRSDSAAPRLINVLTFAAAAEISNTFMIITSSLLQPRSEPETQTIFIWTETTKVLDRSLILSLRPKTEPTYCCWSRSVVLVTAETLNAVITALG